MFQSRKTSKSDISVITGKTLKISGQADILQHQLRYKQQP